MKGTLLGWSKIVSESRLWHAVVRDDRGRVGFACGDPRPVTGYYDTLPPARDSICTRIGCDELARKAGR